MPDQSTVVAFGDSTTVPREPVSVYPDLLRQHWQERQPPVKVINAGVRDDHTDRARARFAFDGLRDALDPRMIVG